MTRLKLEVEPTFIRRTLASRRSCFTVFWAIARLLVAALLLDMTESELTLRTQSCQFQSARVREQHPVGSLKIKVTFIHLTFIRRPQIKRLGRLFSLLLFGFYSNSGITKTFSLVTVSKRMYLNELILINNKSIFFK